MLFSQKTTLYCHRQIKIKHIQFLSNFENEYSKSLKE